MHIRYYFVTQLQLYPMSVQFFVQPEMTCVITSSIREKLYFVSLYIMSCLPGNEEHEMCKGKHKYYSAQRSVLPDIIDVFVSLFLSVISVRRSLFKFTRDFIWLHIYIYIYIYICVCVCVCVSRENNNKKKQIVGTFVQHSISILIVPVVQFWILL